MVYIDSSRTRASSCAMRERTKSWRAFAASYSAFSERSPCAAAVWSSLGILKVSSCRRSASSFLRRTRIGRSMSGSGGREDAAGDLARLPPVEASGEPRLEGAHHRAEVPGARLGGDLADRLLEGGGVELRRRLGLEHRPLAPILLDGVLPAPLQRELLRLLALADLLTDDLRQIRLGQLGAAALDLEVLHRGDHPAQHIHPRHVA